MIPVLLKILKTGIVSEPAPGAREELRVPDAKAVLIHDEILSKLGRALAIRQIDAGSCNGCELELQMLNGAVYDIERFGLRFVASPRHADVLLVTGPVTRNMQVALQRSWAATPDPKWVVAAGDCARDGGCFAGSPAVVGGVAAVLPVDLHIPGCPPSPHAILEGLVALLGR